MAQHQPPRIHRGTVYGAKHQKGMTLPAISPQRSPTPEQRTARVERERTPQQNSTSRADALAQLVARLTDAARYRIVRSEWKGDASPHFDALAPRLQVAKGDAGCALIERPTIDWEFANSYRVTVAKGIDPILMLALTICKDKLEEKKNDG